MGMGERKLRSKAFKQTTAKTTEKEIYAESLFSSKEIESGLTLECFRQGDSTKVTIGRRVKLIDMHDSIDVFVGVNSVGYVVAAGIDELRRRLKLHKRKGRSIGAEIVDVSELTPTFVVKVR